MCMYLRGFGRIGVLFTAILIPPCHALATRVDLSNPLKALVATALSWSGLIVWTLSWFVLMPLFSALLAKSYRATT
jgi:hypothetical protein